MIPAAAVDGVIDELAPQLAAGDTLIDGGNSHFVDDVRRAAALGERGLHYLDVGVSGGIWGLEQGYCLMIGGDAAAVDAARPVVRVARTRRLGRHTAERRYGAARLPALRPERRRSFREDGAQRHRIRPHGRLRRRIQLAAARQYAASARRASMRRLRRAPCKARISRTTSISQPSPNCGVTAASSARGCSTSPRPRSAATRNSLSFLGEVSDSGEGRWTVNTAVEAGVPVPVLATALFARFASRDHDQFANRLLSAMRREFGGHLERNTAPAK